ncbi:MAG TPA: hypothetical protein VFG89_00875 [Coriobacteriia bacterium]|nr:hypothetical protein [Coriobacteriia bacterium]
MDERPDTENEDLYGDRPHSAAEYAARRRERQAERARRARAARQRRLISSSFSAVAMAIVLAAAWLVIAGFSQIAAVGKAASLLDDADRIIMQADASIWGQTRASGAEEARGIAERVPGAVTLLERASVQAKKAKAPLTWLWKRPANLTAAISARKAMLVPAPALLEVAAQSSSAAPLADSGWEAIERARSETSATVPPKSGADPKALSLCVAAADAVAGDLNLAQQSLSGAQTAFPEAQFGPYLEYATQLQQANRYARRASKALLNEQDLTAASALRTYNSKAKKASTARSKLTLPIQKMIDAGAAAASGERLSVYESARTRAVAADKKLGRATLKARP